MENKNADIYLNTIMAFNSTYQEESLEDNNSNFISLNSSTDSLVKFSQSLFRMLASAALLGNVTALIAGRTGVGVNQGTDTGWCGGGVSGNFRTLKIKLK